MIVVGTTMAAFCTDDPDTSEAWMRNAEAIIASHPEGVQYFVAIQVDARGLAPFAGVLARLAEIGGEYWTYSLDDGRTKVTTANRLRHLVTGQNLVSDYCRAIPTCSRMLFLAADLEPPPDTLPKLLALDHPIVGGHVPTYGLHGPTEPGYPPSWGVQTHMATAAFVLLAREVFNRVGWRWDLDAGMSDDPCLEHDARTLLGHRTLVRHDCVGTHWPQSIPAVEDRGHDMTVHRPNDGRVAVDPVWVDSRA